MTRKYELEMAANLERAEASIRAAKELVTGGYYDFVASRAYYGAFYAATAVLLGEELEFNKHSGVIAAYIGSLSKRAGWTRDMARI